MAGRRTNLALKWLLVAAFATGTLAFATGAGWARWVVAAHGAVGLAVAGLAPWKSMIARRGLRRRRPGRAASIAFAVLIIVALAFGVAHSVGGLALFGVTAMQIHVGAALLAVPLLISHAKARRTRVHRSDFTRREALRAGALLAGTGVAYTGLEGVLRIAGAEGERRRFTGSFEMGSGRPEAMPVTQWLDDRVPETAAEGWRLTVGDGAGTREWSYDELFQFTDRLEATLDCTGGWYASQHWEGVRLSRLLEGRDSGASIVVASATGYRRRFPVAEADRLLLALRAGGQPLSAGHGFPARLVAEGRRGFWWVKWVDRIEVGGAPWWAQPPFPLT